MDFSLSLFHFSGTDGISGGAANHYSPTDEEANANALHKTTTATNQSAPDAAATEEAGESVQRPPMAHLHPQ